MADTPQVADSRFNIRPATKADVLGMNECFMKSFTQPFFTYNFPDNETTRTWTGEAWTMGIENPTIRTFVVEDTQNDNKIAAWCRWQVPQEDGNQEIEWPDPEGKFPDMEVIGSFFGGMEEARHEDMGKKPHWFLEMLLTHEDYQRMGLGGSLIKWGTDKADKDGLDTYLTGSPMGQPYYKQRHGFKHTKYFRFPERPDFPSDFVYEGLVRPPQK